MRIQAFAICAALAAALPSSAGAQYSYDPNNPDEIGKGARYFGSVKDDRGRPVEGATIVVQHAYVFISDYQGRYTGYVPSDLTAKTVTVGCAKPGHGLVKLTRRAGSTKVPGAKQPSQWVQADCLLRRAS